MRDLIHEDETAAVLHAMDHAFDASPPPITGQRDQIHADELAAHDAAWMGKPWEKPADLKPASNDQEKER